MWLSPVHGADFDVWKLSTIFNLVTTGSCDNTCDAVVYALPSIYDTNYIQSSEANYSTSLAPLSNILNMSYKSAYHTRYCLVFIFSRFIAGYSR